MPKHQSTLGQALPSACRVVPVGYWPGLAGRQPLRRLVGSANFQLTRAVCGSTFGVLGRPSQRSESHGVGSGRITKRRSFRQTRRCAQVSQEKYEIRAATAQPTSSDVNTESGAGNFKIPKLSEGAPFSCWARCRTKEKRFACDLRPFGDAARPVEQHRGRWQGRSLGAGSKIRNLTGRPSEQERRQLTDEARPTSPKELLHGSVAGAARRVRS